MSLSMDPPRLADSAISSLINGVINGAISWSAFKTSASVPLFMDGIGSPGITALGNAATVVFALTLIITCITFFVFRRSARKSSVAPASLRSMPFVPTGLRIAALNTLLVFGAFVAAAVLRQRFVGTVSVSPLVATLVVAFMAMAATVFAELRTKREMLAAGAATR